MYIEFVRNLLLQSEASREQEGLGELEDRETRRRTGGKRGGEKVEGERQPQKEDGGQGR